MSSFRFLHISTCLLIAFLPPSFIPVRALQAGSGVASPVRVRRRRRRCGRYGSRRLRRSPAPCGFPRSAAPRFRSTLHPQSIAVMHHTKSARLISGPLLSAVERRALHAKRVTRPFPVAGRSLSARSARNAAGQGAPARRPGRAVQVRRASSCVPAFTCWIATRGKSGAYFVLEIEAAGDARCAARGRVGSGAFAQAAGKILVLGSVDRKPCLKIPGRGLQDRETRRGRGAKAWRGPGRRAE